MSNIIITAINNQNKAYENHIEKALEVIGNRIILDSQYGMTSSFITEDYLYGYGRELQLTFSNNTERFINDLADYLEIDKVLINRVYTGKTEGEARVNAIHINWGEADA